MEDTSPTRPFPLPENPQVVHASTAFGGAVLVLDFDIPMIQDTPSDTNSMFWSDGRQSYSSVGPGPVYHWYSPTHLTISSNGDLPGSDADTCTWVPDETYGIIRLRSTQGAPLVAFSNYPLT